MSEQSIRRLQCTEVSEEAPAGCADNRVRPPQWHDWKGNGCTNSLMGNTWQIYIYLGGCIEAEHTLLYILCVFVLTKQREVKGLDTNKAKKLLI